MDCWKPERSRIELKLVGVGEDEKDLGSNKEHLAVTDYYSELVGRV